MIRSIIFLLTFLMYAFGLHAKQNKISKYEVTPDEELKTACIHYAILDFVKNNKNFKQDTLYHVYYMDNVFEESVDLDDYFIKNKSNRCKDIVCVIIGAEYSSKSIFLDSDNVDDVDSEISPYHLLVINKSLFFWEDQSVVYTNNHVALLRRSHKVFPYKRGYPISHVSRTFYYFCKNDILKYISVDAENGDVRRISCDICK